MKKVTSWKQLKVGQWIDISIRNIKQVGKIIRYEEIITPIIKFRGVFHMDMWEKEKGEFRQTFSATFFTDRPLKELSRDVYILNKKEEGNLKKELLLAELENRIITERPHDIHSIYFRDYGLESR